MFYNQYPYTVFNQTWLEGYQQQSNTISIIQHNAEQQNHICEMRKAISDYCNAARRITPDYRQQALYVCLEEIMKQAMIDGFQI